LSKADAVAAVLWVGATLYAVFGGADFGAGFWALVAGGERRGERPRALIDWAIGPVWEANHVWLIFVLVVLWTAFSPAFAAIMSTLFIPLSLAAFGIVLRGSGFAFHKLAPRVGGQRFSEYLFAAHPCSRRSSWARSWARSHRAVCRSGTPPGSRDQLAERRLARDRRALRRNRRVPGRGLPRQRSAERRAPPTSRSTFGDAPWLPPSWPAPIAIAGLFVLRHDARYLYDRLTDQALPLVIGSAVCGIAALALLARRAERGARPLAVGAVAAVVWGWGVAQFPYLLPKSLTISAGAAPSATLTSVLVVFGAAVLLVLPALALLYLLSQRSMLEGERSVLRPPPDDGGLPGTT
jgi:cytochrome d ubiquinol oxidase subunit II